MARLDRTNLRLLEELQKDARVSFAELARTVNRAESTVRERIAGLERDGILRGYHARVDANKVGFRARALLRADCDLAHVEDLAKHLDGVAQVTRAKLLTGPKPLIVEVVAEDLEQLEQVVEKRLSSARLGSLEVAIEVRPLISERPLPIRSALGIPRSRQGDAESIGPFNGVGGLRRGVPSRGRLLR